jgi:hypothetical protein
MAFLLAYSAYLILSRRRGVRDSRLDTPVITVAQYAAQPDAQHNLAEDAKGRRLKNTIRLVGFAPREWVLAWCKPES